MVRKKVDRKDKKCYREFVWLAASEYAHLCELLGKEATDGWIEELNLYIGSKGDAYESHYYTIQTWARREKAKSDGGGKREEGGRTMDAEARRAADRVIEALKNPVNKFRPSFEEKVKLAVHAVCLARKQDWPTLRALREDPVELEKLREELVRMLRSDKDAK